MSFDDVSHVYTIRGERVPSVTQIVTDENPWWTDDARARGKAIHKWTMRRDQGVARVDDLPDEWRGYARAYERAIMELRPLWTEIEIARTNSTLRYGGKRDRVGVVLSRAVIVDFKTGDAEASHGPQLAGYDLLDRERYQVARLRFGLYLDRDGRYRLRPFDNPGDYAVFLSRLRQFHERTVQGVGEL